MDFSSIWVGASSYREGEAIQKKFWQKSLDENRCYFLGFEFQPVVTLGKRSDPRLDLLKPTSELYKLGFEIIKADRGGHATLHNEGQLVIYPVIPLKALNLNLVDFIAGLQTATQQFLHEFNIEAFPAKDPGLYTAQGKIAFFGLRILRGISQHGLSINVSNDLTAFECIRSCGKALEKFDRMADHGLYGVSIEELFFFWAQVATTVFQPAQSVGEPVTTPTHPTFVTDNLPVTL